LAITDCLRASDFFCPGIFKSTMIGLLDLKWTTLPPFISYDHTETSPTKLEKALYIAKAHGIWRYRAPYSSCRKWQVGRGRDDEQEEKGMISQSELGGAIR
jgi:hypothetical protein